MLCIIIMYFHVHVHVLYVLYVYTFSVQSTNNEVISLYLQDRLEYSRFKQDLEDANWDQVHTQ